MSIEINGVAHIQMTLREPESGLPFWERLCHFLGMKTLIRNDDTVYCIGGRTGILVRAAPQDKRDRVFDQWTPGLHHLCLRARSAKDVDRVHEYARDELGAKIVHPPEAGEHFAPGYYSVLFEDPDGIRVEVNHVPGQGHFGEKGRLGPGGSGPAKRYGEEGLG
ncbi:MAG: VOC family protein [Pseudomonadales bacterium]|nr:VOC family protein [Pseudomonadales bacterium]